MLPAVQLYASGLSRAADFEAASAAEHGVGVVAGELSSVALDALAMIAVDRRTPIFVDSGAYGHFRRFGRAPASGLDFTRVLTRYDRVLQAISDANSAEEQLIPPLLVVPDAPGDQLGTLRLLGQHSAYVTGLLAFPRLARPVIPFHGGPRPLSRVFHGLCDLFGRDDFVVGLPSSGAALALDAAGELFANAQVRAVHLLGALATRRIASRLAPISASGRPSPSHLSADANPLRSRVLRRARQGCDRRAAIVAILGEDARGRELDALLRETGGLRGLRVAYLTGASAERRKLLRFLAWAVDQPPAMAAHHFGLQAGVAPLATLEPLEQAA